MSKHHTPSPWYADDEDLTAWEVQVDTILDGAAQATTEDDAMAVVYGWDAVAGGVEG